MKTKDLPLDDDVKKALLEAGYKELYPPQELAIRKGLFSGKNLVVAAPTASGKTLIAMFAAAHHLTNHLGKTVYLTPLRALAYEKFSDLKLLERAGARIRISTGDYDTPGHELRDADIIVTTNEKMDSLMRHSAPWLRDVSLVVVDEVHLVGLDDRGPTLEVLVTRMIDELENPQILALSATISNSQEIAEWIEGDVVSVDWRPVPLREGFFFQYKVTFNDGSVTKIRHLTGSPSIDLAIDELLRGGQAITFTRTRNDAVRTAMRISKAISENPSLKRLVNQAELKRVADEILVTGERTQLSELLAELVRSGVAFHHAGLLSSHRRIIEKAFREGAIKLLTATPTLAAGVNLPSRRVVITYTSRYSLGYSQPITVFEYKQMAGRAGRPKYDDYGEAILVARSSETAEYLMDVYVMGEPERIESKLGDGRTLEAHLLGLIAGRGSIRIDEIRKFFERTLYAVQSSIAALEREIGRALRSLIANEMVNTVDSTYTPTKIGKRVSELYISPLTGALFRDFSRELSPKDDQLKYLLIVCSSPDMPTFSVRRREAEKVEEEIYRRGLWDCYERLPYEHGDPLEAAKTALVLNDWIEEFGEERLLRDWRVEPGDVHSAAYSAEWLLYAASQISLLTGSFSAAKRFHILSLRVKHGVKEELLDLVRLEGVGRARARALYNSGLKTIEEIATADTGRLARVPGIGEKLAKRIKDQARSIADKPQP